jgi:hypothetical protein
LEPDTGAAPSTWRDQSNALSGDVNAVLARADLAAEQTAARLRLAVLILHGLVLVGLGSLAGVYNEWTVAIFGVNLGTLYFV